MSLSQLTSAHLKKAAKLISKKDGFLAKIKVIENELESLIGGTVPDSEKRPRKKRRKMSAAARAKIATAQKKRWATAKAKGPKPPEPK